MLIGACSTVTPSPSQSQSGFAEPLAHLEVDDLSFDYPSSWAAHTQMPATTGFGQPLAILGTEPWGPCAMIDINCHFAQRLGPGQIDVQVDAVSDGGSDLCSRRTLPLPSSATTPTRTLLRIDGRPAMLLTYPWSGRDYYGADAEKVWSIAINGTVLRWIVIDGRYRGPGDDQFSAALDGVIASLVVQSAVPGEQGPTDCESPVPTGGA